MLASGQRCHICDGRSRVLEPFAIVSVSVDAASEVLNALDADDDDDDDDDDVDGDDGGGGGGGSGGGGTRMRNGKSSRRRRASTMPLSALLGTVCLPQLLSACLNCCLPV
jgi:hypothetical protein